MISKKQIKHLEKAAQEFCDLALNDVVQRAEKILTSRPANNPPPVGEFWPGQGGIYAGIIRNPENGQRWHLIAHPEVLGKNDWGKIGKDTKATSKADGAANTQILAAGDHPAAAMAAKAVADGHTDYYLPAQTELQLLHANLHDKLGDDACWTSTQFSAHLAWSQDFETGRHRINGKGLRLAVRAVRRILIL